MLSAPTFSTVPLQHTRKVGYFYKKKSDRARSARSRVITLVELMLSESPMHISHGHGHLGEAPASPSILLQPLVRSGMHVGRLRAAFVWVLLPDVGPMRPRRRLKDKRNMNRRRPLRCISHIFVQVFINPEIRRARYCRFLRITTFTSVAIYR